MLHEGPMAEAACQGGVPDASPVVAGGVCGTMGGLPERRGTRAPLPQPELLVGAQAR